MQYCFSLYQHNNDRPEFDIEMLGVLGLGEGVHDDHDHDEKT